MVMSLQELPDDLGLTLAWAPVPAVEQVEVLDRFNGVPTLGIFSADGERTLFWRTLGYVSAKISIWLYADGRVRGTPCVIPRSFGHIDWTTVPVACGSLRGRRRHGERLREQFRA